MSWYANALSVPREPEVAERQIRAVQPTGTEGAADEVAEQYEVAVAAALAIIASGSVGTTASLRVALSGHANPGHGKREGWANDTITVTVSEH